MLRRTLLAGAFYDLVLGAGTALAGPAILASLGAPVADRFLFTLALLPLFVLPVLYRAAARASDLAPFRLPVLWARAGGGGLILVLTLVLRPGAAGIYLAIAVVDLGWAALHAALWPRRGAGAV
jgi:hypothetical protein